MKNILLIIISLLIWAANAQAQVTNLTVNGQTSTFSMNSGDVLSWSYNVPNPGDTTLLEIWVDVNQNGVLDPADVIWTFFYQIDGDNNGQNGPPDIDGAVNSHVAFQQNLGLAPAHYIMVFKNHNNYKYFAGTVNSLASPTFTISGTVTVPSGVSKKNIMLSLEAQGGNGGKPFWDALTDDNGNYTIQMNSDTSGNPWSVKTNNNILFGSSIIAPDGYEFTIAPGTSSYTGKDFTVTASAAEIKGTIKNENGIPFVGTGIQLNANSGTIQRDAQTDTAGVFHLGFLSSELPQTNVGIFSEQSNDTTIMQAAYQFPSIASGNVLTHDVIIYKVNSVISGRITLGGNPPNSNLQLMAINNDTCLATVNTDQSGNFRFHVTDKVFNYQISPSFVPGGFNFKSITAHPGQTNVLLDLSVTGIKPGNPGTPAKFSLSQNYPNPFNPTTTIDYSLAKSGNVRLTVYNSIGSKVAVISDGYKPAGNYSIKFDGTKLSSGIYLYKLESGNYTATRKFILMK